MPKVSVIVPVYNVEKYLDRCIQSILNQTFTDFELILVNDGSPDNCGKICDEYAKKDNRVKVIHKQNAGVSAARNTGIDKACGEYIMFVDSDDYIDLDMLKKMLSMSSSSVDLIVSSIKMITMDNGKENYFLMEDKIYTIEGLLLDFLLQSFPIICLCGPCCKLYKSNIVKTNNVRFNTGMSLGEDTCFNLDYIKKCEKNIVTMSSCYYNYIREREDSLFTKFRISYYHDSKTVFERKMQIAEKLNLDDNIKSDMTRNYINRCISNILKASNTSDQKTVKEYLTLLADDEFFVKNYIHLKSNLKSYLVAKLIVKKKFTLIFIIIKIRNFLKGK